MNEELDSQLSAMFDDELPESQCELLARRLSRDSELQSRWGRYAVVGAAIRAEQGVRLNVALARRVSTLVVGEPALCAAAVVPAARRNWWQPLAGAAVAAGVAAICVTWLRAQDPSAAAPVVRVTPPAAGLASIPAAAAPLPLPDTRQTPASARASYTVPPVQSGASLTVPGTELANYVVAHSMVSSPVNRRNLLSAFVTEEPQASAPPVAPDTVQ